MNTSYSYLQAETAGDNEAEFAPSLADLNNAGTWSFLAMITV